MNFVLYKECLNPCHLKQLQFTFHLFHKFSTQDKGSHVFISKGNNLPTILVNVDLKRLYIWVNKGFKSTYVVHSIYIYIYDHTRRHYSAR